MPAQVQYFRQILMSSVVQVEARITQCSKSLARDRAPSLQEDTNYQQQALVCVQLGMVVNTDKHILPFSYSSTLIQ